MYLGSKLAHDLCNIARELGRPSAAPTAYDTALAAVQSTPGDPTRPAFPQALDWLLQTQHGDGTWGGAITHHHDRVVSTLAALAALAKWRETAPAPLLLQERIGAAAWGAGAHFARLHLDLQPTAGFLQVIGRLVAEARWRGIAVPGAPPSPSPLAGGLGSERLAMADDVAADGAATPLLPLPALETAWVIHALALIGPPRTSSMDSLTPSLGRLMDLLQQPAVAQPTDLLPAADIDARAMAFRVLTWAGHQPDATSLLAWLDSPAAVAGPASALALAHLFEALNDAAPFAGKERGTRRALALLTESCGAEGQWFDHRHASPFLPTAHAIIALPASLTLTRDAVRYLEDAQLSDGSWGYFDRGTVEETAYCLQALGRHHRAGGAVNPQQLEAGARWLAARAGQGHHEHPPLFVGRALYCPTRMVEAAALAALAITEG
jgi:hypothetical protein